MIVLISALIPIFHVSRSDAKVAKSKQDFDYIIEFNSNQIVNPFDIRSSLPNEANDNKELTWLAEKRKKEPALNVIELLFNPKNLIKKAGRGLREGFKDVGSLLE